jgi:hypothetical protein
MKRQTRPKPHPNQTVLESIKTIQMFVRGTSYETYVQKELERIRKVLLGK